MTDRSDTAHYERERQYWDQRGQSDYHSLSDRDCQRLRQWVGTLPAGYCLDLGGGSGMGARLLAPMPGVEVITCDISHAMLSHCRGHAVQGDALRLPFADASFSSIIAAAFFHHLPGREKALLDECARVLRPGGRILGYDPTATAWANRIFMMDGPFRLKFFSPDERPVDPRQFGQTLGVAGFGAMQHRYFSFRNRHLTAFEAIQRYLLDPVAHGPLAPRLRRWFFWESERLQGGSGP